MKFLTPSKLLLLVLILLAVGFGVYKARQPSAASTSGIGVVERMDLEQRVTISGTIAPKRRSDVRPPYNGYIQKLYVKVGQKVREGEPLVTFVQTLAGSETTYPVRAAYSGTVTQVLKTEGEYVSEQGEQTIIVRVEDLSSLNVQASVPELDIAKIKRGQAAMVRVAALAGETFEGEISEISLGAKDKERFASASTEFQIRVQLKTNDPRLYPGMSALMDVITDSRENVLALTHEFIHEDAGKYFVVLEDGSKKGITLGLQTEEAAEVKTGLVEGERVRVIDYLNLPKIEE